MKTKCLGPLLLMAFTSVGLLSFAPDPAEEGKQLANQYCGSCHLPPDPKSLPQYLWRMNVLPVMGAYLGIRYQDFDPYRHLTAEEIALLQKRHLYPLQPALNQASWQKIVDYYLNNSPVTNSIDSTRQHRNRPLKQFDTQFVALNKQGGSMVTALAYDTSQHRLWASEPGKLYAWSWPRGLTRQYELPATIVDIKFSPQGMLLTDIGQLMPSDLSKGSLFSLAGDQLVSLQSPLHRPVYSMAADLDEDGVPEVITANYGYHWGSLSLYRQPVHGESVHPEQVLSNAPGAVKFYVRDMNGDHRKDIVALFGQQLESIYIFFQRDSLQFTAKKVLQFEPQYGTSDFVLLDYNHDGIQDIALVQGDNADYSYCSKAFHGLNLYLGGQDQVFTHAFFYPIYGATRLQADDFDQDGDVDFAISSFFPELSSLSDESFVYLENKHSDAYKFSSQVVHTSLPLKSLTLEKADIDQDGDMDLILGQFSHSPTPVPAELQQAWNQVHYQLILLLNRQVR